MPKQGPLVGGREVPNSASANLSPSSGGLEAATFGSSRDDMESGDVRIPPILPKEGFRRSVCERGLSVVDPEEPDTSEGVLLGGSNGIGLGGGRLSTKFCASNLDIFSDSLKTFLELIGCRGGS